MKVLHVHKVTRIGGSERHLADLLPALRNRGIDAQACILTTKSSEGFLEVLKARGIPVMPLPAGPDANPLLVGRLVKLFRSLRPDLVHTHLVHADLHGGAAARLAGIPCVASFHSIHRFFSATPVQTAWRLVGRHLTATIAISNAVAQYVTSIGLIDADRVRTIHYGIDASRWTDIEALRSAQRAAWGWDEDDIVLAMVGRLIPGKGHAQVLCAAAAVARRGRAIRLLIAGDGPLRRELEQQAAKLAGDRLEIHLLGDVPDVRPVYAAADIVAVPTSTSLGEGFGLAALEAQAAGRPVIASRVGALPEVVVDGTTGRLVLPDDIEDLARALDELAADAALRRRMGEAGRARAVERFGLEPMVDRVVEVYESALNGSNGVESAMPRPAPVPPLLDDGSPLSITDRYWEVFDAKRQFPGARRIVTRADRNPDPIVPGDPVGELFRRELSCAGSLLDVGAGNRRLLHCLRTLGLDCDYRSADVEKLHLHDFDDFLGVRERFDAILMLELIEHLPLEQGIAFLEHARRLLSDQGVLILSTPNVYHANFVWRVELTHIRPWPQADLYGVLQVVGFTDISMYKVRHCPTWRRALVSPLHRGLCKLLELEDAQGVIAVARPSQP